MSKIKEINEYAEEVEEELENIEVTVQAEDIEEALESVDLENPE